MLIQGGLFNHFAFISELGEGRRAALIALGRPIPVLIELAALFICSPFIHFIDLPEGALSKTENPANSGKPALIPSLIEGVITGCSISQYGSGNLSPFAYPPQ